MGMLDTTIAEILIRARNETGPAFAEVSAGLKAVQADADLSATAMARAGTVVESSNGTVIASSGLAAKSLDAQLAAVIKSADATEAAGVKSIKGSDTAIRAAQARQVAVARSYEVEAAAAEASAKKQNAAFSSIAKGSLLVSAGILGVGYVTGKMASTFSRDMEMISTQAGASQAEVAKMTPLLLALAGPLGTAPDLLAQSLYHVESSGVRGAKALDMVKLAAEGAKVGNADLQDTTQAVIGIMSSQIKGIKDATEAMAFMNATVGAGDMRMEQLDKSIATGVLPAFHNFGLGIRDFGAALATMTDNVTPADEAATRLRMTVSQLGAPSEKAITQLGKIGIGATQLAQDMRQPNGLLVAIEDLKKHLEDSGKSAVDQAAIISRAFGGGRSSAGIETLLSELDKFKSKYSDIDAGTRKWAEDWDKTQKQATFAASQADASAKALGITIGTDVLPVAEKLMVETTKIATETEDWTIKNHGLAEALLVGGGVVAATLALAAAVLKVRAGYILVKEAAEAAKLAEIGAAAVAVSPVLAAAGIGAIAGYELQTHLDAENKANQVKFLKEITKAYEDGKMSTADYAKGLKALSELTPDVKALTQAQIEGTKAGKEHAAAIDKLGRSSVDVANDFRDARLRIAETNREHIAAATAVHTHQTELQKLDAEIKRVLASEIALTTEGLKKEESAFTSMADHAISEATRMKAGVEAQVKAMNVAITKSVSWTPIIQPQTIQTTTATPTQFATSGPTYNPKGAETLDPALGKDMGQLSSALDNLPAKFQATGDAWIQKFKNEETNLYDKHLGSLNKENQRDAEAIGKINADYRAKVEAASKEANAREVTENTRYLDKLDSLERAHNDRLQAIQNAFITSYQSSVLKYQTALSQIQMKAEADATKHEDKLRQLAADEAAKLAAVHGKNAAALREQIEKNYARDIANADTNYGRIVTANENHVTGISKAFDKHIKDLADWANRQIAQANTHLISGKESAAQRHAEAIKGLDNFLKGRDNKAQADREAALLKEEGIHVKNQNGIITAFDKGGKIIEQSIDKSFAKIPALMAKAFPGSDWGLLAGAPTVLPPLGPGSVQSGITGGLTSVALGPKPAPLDPNAAKESTAVGMLAELQHQSVLIGQQNGLSADDIKIQEDRNRIVQDNWKIAQATWAEIAVNSDPKSTPEQKAAAHQATIGAMSVKIEDMGQLANDIGQAVANAEQAVQAARNNVIAAESAIAVGLLQEQVTELSDLTGIMQAEANIQTAVVNGQIAAINDQSAILQDNYGIEVANGEIMKASGEITKATDANSRALALAHMVVAQAQLRVAEDHLQIDKTKAQADVVAAAWAVKIAEAEAHMAKDKLAVDKANAEANNKVADAHLKVAQDQLNIAKDQAKLTQDIADGINAVAVEMGADPANIAADKVALSADTALVSGVPGSDTYNESAAQQAAQVTAAQGAYTLGQDQAGITGLQIGATSDSQNYALQLASLTAKEGKDNIDLQRAQAASAALTASNTTTANTLLQSANDALQERNDALTQLIGLMAQGVSWNGVGGDFKGILDQIGLQVHTNK